MTIDTNTVVSMSEANQNFSKVTRIVDQYGRAVVFKNNAPRYMIIDFNLIDNNESDLQSIFDIVQKETNLSGNQIKELFTILFITAHGIASLLANNSMTYNEKECIKLLKKVFYMN